MERIKKRDYERRYKRNKLLKDCDFRVLPDYPDTNKQEWITYRQQLRDFPVKVWIFQLNQNK